MTLNSDPTGTLWTKLWTCDKQTTMSQAKKHGLTGDNGKEDTNSYPSKKHAAECPSKRQDFFDYFQRLPISSPCIFVHILLIQPEHTKILQEELPDLPADKLHETLRELGANNGFLETLAPHLRHKDYAEALDAVKLEVRELNFPTTIPQNHHPNQHSAPSLKPPQPQLGGEFLRDLPNDRISTALYHLYDLIWVQERSVFQTEPKQIPNLKPLPLGFDFSTSPGPQTDLVDGTHLRDATYMTIPAGSLAQFPSQPRYSRTLLVRSGYEDMWDKIEGSGRSSVVVLGQPGIGKTHFLSYLLVKRFEGKKRTFLQLDATDVYCFTERGAFRYNATDPRLSGDCPKDQEIWYLVDSNHGLPSLPNSACNLLLAFSASPIGMAKIIQTASPENTYYKGWVKEQKAITLWMDVCSWEDISLMSLLNERGADSPDIPPTLPFYYHKFGRSARICLRSAKDPSFAHNHDMAIHNAISSLPSNEATRWFPRILGGSHALYMVHPKTHTGRLPRIELASLYVRQQVIAAADRVGRRFLLQLYPILCEHPSFDGDRFGRIFEVIALHLLGRTDRTYQLRSLGNSDAPPTELAVKKATGMCNFSTTLGLGALAKDHPDQLLTPTSPNFAAIDGIIVDNGGTPWLVQTAPASDHGIKARGLGQVLASLTGPEFSSKQISPPKIWKYVFVVPKEQEASFKLQNVIGEGGTAEADGDEKVTSPDVIDQYVLGLDIDSFQEGG